MILDLPWFSLRWKSVCWKSSRCRNEIHESHWERYSQTIPLKIPNHFLGYLKGDSLVPVVSCPTPGAAFYGDPHHVTARIFSFIISSRGKSSRSYPSEYIISKGFISFGFDFCPTAAAEKNTSLAFYAWFTPLLCITKPTKVPPPK